MIFLHCIIFQFAICWILILLFQYARYKLIILIKSGSWIIGSFLPRFIFELMIDISQQLLVFNSRRSVLGFSLPHMSDSLINFSSFPIDFTKLLIWYFVRKILHYVEFSSILYILTMNRLNGVKLWIIAWIFCVSDVHRNIIINILFNSAILCVVFKLFDSVLCAYVWFVLSVIYWLFFLCVVKCS